MNLPNKLSLARILLIPLLVIMMYLPGAWRYGALAVFIIASCTDYLDGRIARTQGLVTDLGRFLDPVADKLLVLSSMIMLIHQQLLPAFVVVIVLARELSVDGLRMIAVGKGQVIAAGQLGKVKTVTQMALIIWLLFSGRPALEHPIGIALCAWAVIITLWSGVDYFCRHKDVFRSNDKPT